MQFLCGCTSEGRERYSLLVTTLGLIQRTDSNGNRVCPEHGVREVGWRTTDDIKRGILPSRVGK
jgi:hypothetical protein